MHRYMVSCLTWSKNLCHVTINVLERVEFRIFVLIFFQLRLRVENFNKYLTRPTRWATEDISRLGFFLAILMIFMEERFSINSCLFACIWEFWHLQALYLIKVENSIKIWLKCRLILIKLYQVGPKLKDLNLDFIESKLNWIYFLLLKNVILKSESSQTSLFIGV